MSITWQIASLDDLRERLRRFGQHTPGGIDLTGSGCRWDAGRGATVSLSDDDNPDLNQGVWHMGLAMDDVDVAEHIDEWGQIVAMGSGQEPVTRETLIYEMTQRYGAAEAEAVTDVIVRIVEAWLNQRSDQVWDVDTLAEVWSDEMGRADEAV